MKYTSVFASILLTIWTMAIGVSGQTLKADYRFQGNLTSSVAGAAAMTNLTGANGANSFITETVDGYSRQSLRFPLDSGVAVNTSGLISNTAYTAVILFKMDDLTAYRRVMDATNGLDDDCGAYIFNSRFDGESTADTNSILIPSLYVQATIVRESTGRIRAYRDGRLKVDLPNDGGCFQILTNTLRFFQDDTDIGGEASAGNVARIRLYDAPMTDAQVRALDRVENAIGGGEQPILSHSDRDGNFEIYSMNEDGSNQLRLTNNSATDTFPDWSPVRQKIVFGTTRDGNYEVYTMNLDGTGETRITNNPSTDYSPRWSPDGNRILFSRCDTVTGVCDVWVMNADGTGQTNLTNTTADDDNAQWSPDGTKIVFASLRNGATNEIYTMSADGSNVVRLTNNAVEDLRPTFSPNGTKIAFASTRDGIWPDIYSMNADGSSQTRLTFFGGEDSFPVWSPDGTKIMYSTLRDTSTPTTNAGNEIYVMNADGSSLTRTTFNNRIDTVTAWRGQPVATEATVFDYDGDGRSDLSVFRPSDNMWYVLRGTAGYMAMGFGEAGDLLAPADYDGDAKTDIAVFRPSTGTWFIFNSASQTFVTVGWGANGDVPVPADHDGDGKSDLVVFRQSTGQWFTRFSLNNSFSTVGFGGVGDKPVAGDFDADGKADIALFRPSDNNWYILKTGFGFFIQTWGEAGDVPVPADYDGDGKTDVAVWRPSTGQWFRIRSTAGFDSVGWGANGDKPIPADYDGDGKSDVAVFRPSSGTWYIVGSTAGQIINSFGQNGDLPTQGAFIY